ncbi:MAG: AMP-binding protein [Pseudomonadota bacterium]
MNGDGGWTAPWIDELDGFDGLSIRALIELRARQTGDAVWLIDPEAGETLSYADLLAACRRVAGFLDAEGVAVGASVGFAASNSADTAAVVLGIAFAGRRATAINLVAGADTIDYVAQHAGCALILHDGVGREALPDTVVQRTQLATCADALAGSPCEAGPAVPPSSDGLLMYTSGTTGRPKGVRLSHGNLIAGGRNTALAHQIAAGDRALCVLPLYHINGLCVTVFAPLVSGGSVVMPPRFSVTAFWDWIATHRCTWFSVVPTQISWLVHAERGRTVDNTEALRFGRSASAPLSPDVHRAFESRFGVPLIETMGLTETAAQILSNPMPPGECKHGSPGVAVGNAVEIIDTRTGQRCAAGAEGEIRVRGANVMQGYLDNPEATAAALDSDGWLCTGDLGRMDADGYVFVTGRLKELIIKGGENIAPREIDEALLTHPDVIEAAAFARPCTDFGQRVEAGVVLRSTADSTPETLRAHCVSRVGAFKSPDRVHVLDTLPKGPSGKVQRLKLADALSGQ